MASGSKINQRSSEAWGCHRGVQPANILSNGSTVAYSSQGIVSSQHVSVGSQHGPINSHGAVHPGAFGFASHWSVGSSGSVWVSPPLKEYIDIEVT